MRIVHSSYKRQYSKTYKECAHQYLERFFLILKMDPFEVKMNQALQKLAKDIIPDDEQLKQIKICADKVS